MMKRRVDEWLSDFAVPDGDLARAMLETYSWDELNGLCGFINELDPSLEPYHRVIMDNDLTRIISSDEWERIKWHYIDTATTLDYDYRVYRRYIADAPLRQCKMWEVYCKHYELKEMVTMINELVDESNDDWLKTAWALYTNDELEDYIIEPKLSTDIENHIYNLLDAWGEV